jgi:DNA-binding NtrC family response regulator
MTRTNPPKRILVVDDEPMIVSLLSTVLREKGWDVTEARSGSDGIDQLDRGGFDVILTDLVMPGDSGIDLLRAAKEIHPDVEVILMTGYATTDTAIEAMRNGAFHYIMKPLKTEEVANLVEKAYTQRQLRRENRILKSEIDAAHYVQSVVGDSEAVLRLIAALKGIAGVDDPVLLVGERGTGRGFFARFIHFHSRRSAGLYVPVACAGVPEDQLAAELFGNPGAAGDRESPPRAGRMELRTTGRCTADIAEAGRGSSNGWSGSSPRRRSPPTAERKGTGWTFGSSPPPRSPSRSWSIGGTSRRVCSRRCSPGRCTSPRFATTART